MKDEFVNYREPFVTHSESNKHKRFNLASKLVQLWNWLTRFIRLKTDLVLPIG